MMRRSRKHPRLVQPDPPLADVKYARSSLRCSCGQSGRRFLLLGLAVALVSFLCWCPSSSTAPESTTSSTTSTSNTTRSSTNTRSPSISTHSTHLTATSNATQNTTYYYRNINYSTTTSASLQPWEYDAIQQLSQGSTECRYAAADTHDTCCPGSFSQGGTVTATPRLFCSHANFAKVEALARHFLQEEWPLVPQKTTTTTTTTTNSHCDVCAIMEQLRYYNEPLILLGDSLTMQTVDGLVCELERQHHVVTTTSTFVNTKTNTTGHGTVKSITTMNVTSPTLWSTGNDVVIIKVYFIYSVPFEEAREMNNGRGGVLLFNFGLHANDVPIFESNMRWLFLTLKQVNRFSLVLFRETTAQHFDVPDGMYAKDHRSNHCRPHEAPTNNARDATVRNAAHNAGIHMLSPLEATLDNTSTVVVLPYYNFTAQLHDVHPILKNDNGALVMGECTHYCSTPFLWMPIWRTMRISIETAFAGQNATIPRDIEETPMERWRNSFVAN